MSCMGQAKLNRKTGWAMCVMDMCDVYQASNITYQNLALFSQVHSDLQSDMCFGVVQVLVTTNSRGLFHEHRNSSLKSCPATVISCLEKHCRNAECFPARIVKREVPDDNKPFWFMRKTQTQSTAPPDQTTHRATGESFKGSGKGTGILMEVIRETETGQHKVTQWGFQKKLHI